MELWTTRDRLHRRFPNIAASPFRRFANDEERNRPDSNRVKLDGPARQASVLPYNAIKRLHAFSACGSL
jgi:hypothetical protein